MTYIPVGTRLTYTATYSRYSGGLLLGLGWSDLGSKLKTDLPNLQGQEDLEVENVSGSTSILLGNEGISLDVLNNGVDHSSETDVQSLIDGTITGYGIQLLSSNITSITLPNNPGDDINQGQTIATGAVANAPPPTTPSSSSGFSLSSLLPSAGTKLGAGFILLILGIIALIFLLPGGFAKSLKAIR